MKKIISIIILSSLGVVACGGGGDSGSSSGGSNSAFTAASRIQISSTNSNEVAGESAGTLNSTAVGGTASRGVVSSGQTNNRLINVLNKIKADISYQARSEFVATTQTFSENCATSGSFTGVVDTTAKTYSATFNQCVEYGQTMNGSMSGTIDSGSNITVTFSNFSSSDSDYSMSMTGTMSFTNTSFASYEHTVISATNILMTMTYEGRTISLGNLNLDYKDYSSYNISEFTLDYNSSDLGGSLRVESVAPLYQNYSDDYPYHGSFKVTGALNSAIKITAVDATTVSIEKDLDGDGTFSAAVNDTWANLKNYL